MITYETYCQIRLFHQQRGLSFKQIAGELGIRPQTVAKYANLATFTRCATTIRVTP
jgi:transcriptional regulator with XRE-family HTH domain